MIFSKPQQIKPTTAIISTLLNATHNVQQKDQPNDMVSSAYMESVLQFLNKKHSQTALRKSKTDTFTVFSSFSYDPEWHTFIRSVTTLSSITCHNQRSTIQAIAWSATELAVTNIRFLELKSASPSAKDISRHASQRESKSS